MATQMEQMCLIDAENNNEYNIIISCEDGKKAKQDMNFATLLLQQAKQRSLVQSPVLNKFHATSPTINSPSTSANSSDNAENLEGTHIWGKEETLLLLNIYSEYKEQIHNGKCTMKQYWEKIAKIMRDKGYDVTGFKCSTKFQALKRTYKGVIDHNSKSGNNPKQWEYFKIMQELFADKPWVQPISVAGSHIKEIIAEQKVDNPPQKCVKKRKLNSTIEQYIKDSKEEQQKRREIREKHHSEKMMAFKRIENLVEKVLNAKD